ncbi:trypsin-1-like isoform X1 [Homarus americanus]|uniref:trypsin-1-like isoform X1 n=1 Tax=Homarus americanus TaxID=6706 RepID=UPI001C496546|nr:trypsin-1-like isoform X1 [Homarus americanus]
MTTALLICECCLPVPFLSLLLYRDELQVSSTQGVLVGVLAESSSHRVRIAGGHDAQKGDYPWLVSIQATNFQQSWPLCSGVLLTPEWVLTAAHCLDSEKPEWLWVVSGEYDTTIDEGTEQHLYVDYFIKHPEYTYWEMPYHNDVGLVHLSTPATLDLYTDVAPVPADSSQILTGRCQEAGWGATKDGGPAATILQWTEVPLLIPDYCEDAYSFPPDPNALCAGNLQGGVGACTGDNGGGLVCEDPETGAYIVGGIMSWREGCARKNLPAVYMSVARYRDWIIGTINQPQL